MYDQAIIILLVLFLVTLCYYVIGNRIFHPQRSRGIFFRLWLGAGIVLRSLGLLSPMRLQQRLIVFFLMSAATVWCVNDLLTWQQPNFFVILFIVLFVRRIHNIHEVMSSDPRYSRVPSGSSFTDYLRQVPGNPAYPYVPSRIQLRPVGPEELDCGEVTFLESSCCSICCDEVRETIEKVVYCRCCNTPYHKDCWSYVGKCSVYGCSSTRKRGRRSAPGQVA